MDKSRYFGKKRTGGLRFSCLSRRQAFARDRCSEFGDTYNGLPKFVIEEFERYLECGILAYGFARVRCRHCHDEILVGFHVKVEDYVPLVEQDA